jgi:SUMO ligase MMS21 Smc5/6 complex component
VIFEELIGAAQITAGEELGRRVASHPRMKEFRARVWASRHPGEPIPGEEDDVAVAVVAGARSTTCPITRSRYVKPVRNKVCGHTYSEHAIREYLTTKFRGQAGACAVAGCEASVSLRSLEPDLEMERELRRMQFRQQPDSFSITSTTPAAAATGTATQTAAGEDFTDL